jgi:hypothetical protein
MDPGAQMLVESQSSVATWRRQRMCSACLVRSVRLALSVTLRYNATCNLRLALTVTVGLGALASRRAGGASHYKETIDADEER